MNLRNRLEAVVMQNQLYTGDADEREDFLDDLIDAVLAGRMPPHHVWVYQSRGGTLQVHKHFYTARRQQDEDNGLTLDEIIEQGRRVVGSEGDGTFWIDGGGDITLLEVR